MKLLKDCKAEVIEQLSSAFGTVKLAVDDDVKISCVVGRTKKPLEYQIFVFINGQINMKMGLDEPEKVKPFWRPFNVFSRSEKVRYPKRKDKIIYLASWKNPKSMVAWMLRHNPEIKVTDIGLDHPTVLI